MVNHDIADEDKVYECHNGELHKIGKDTSEKLKFISDQIKVIDHVRPKYTCRVCEKDDISNNNKQTPVANPVTPKGYATAIC